MNKLHMRKSQISSACDLYLPYSLISNDTPLRKSLTLLLNFHSLSPKRYHGISIDRMLNAAQIYLIFSVFTSLMCVQYKPVDVALLASFVYIISFDLISYSLMSSVAYIAYDVGASGLIEAIAIEWLQLESDLSHPQRLGSFKDVWSHLYSRHSLGKLADTMLIPNGAGAMWNVSSHEARIALNCTLLFSHAEKEFYNAIREQRFPVSTRRYPQHAQLGEGVEIETRLGAVTLPGDSSDFDVEGGKIHSNSNYFCLPFSIVPNYIFGNGSNSDSMASLRYRLRDEYSGQVELDKVAGARLTFLFLLDHLPLDARVILSIQRTIDLQGNDVFCSFPVPLSPSREAKPLNSLHEVMMCTYHILLTSMTTLGVALILALFFYTCSKSLFLRWLQSFALWIIFTSCFVEPLWILAIHYWLPITISDDISEAKSSVLSTLSRHMLYDIVSHPRGLVTKFCTSKYILPSCRIAHDFQSEMSGVHRLVAMYEPLNHFMYPLNNMRMLHPFKEEFVHRMATISQLRCDEDRDLDGRWHMETLPPNRSPPSEDETHDVLLVGGRKRSRSRSHSAANSVLPFPMPSGNGQKSIGFPYVPLIDPLDSTSMSKRTTLRFLLAAFIRSVSLLHYRGMNYYGKYFCTLSSKGQQYLASHLTGTCGTIISIVIQLIIFGLLVGTVFVHMALSNISPGLVVLPEAVCVIIVLVIYSFEYFTPSITFIAADDESWDKCTCSHSASTAHTPHFLYDASKTGLKHVTQCSCLICLTLEKYSADCGHQKCFYCERKYIEKISQPHLQSDQSRATGNNLAELSAFLVEAHHQQQHQLTINADRLESNGSVMGAVGSDDDILEDRYQIDESNPLVGGLSSASSSVAPLQHIPRSPSNSSSDSNWSKMSPQKMASALGITVISNEDDSFSILTPGKSIYPIAAGDECLLELQPPPRSHSTSPVIAHKDMMSTTVQHWAHLTAESGTQSCAVYSDRPSTVQAPISYSDEKSYKKALSVRENYQSESLARYQDMLLQRSVAKLQLKQRRSAAAQKNASACALPRVPSELEKDAEVNAGDECDIWRCTSPPDSVISQGKPSTRSPRRREDTVAAVKSRLTRNLSPSNGQRRRAISDDSERTGDMTSDDEFADRAKTREVQYEHRFSMMGLEEDINKDKKRSQDLLARRLNQRRTVVDPTSELSQHQSPVDS